MAATQREKITVTVQGANNFSQDVWVNIDPSQTTTTVSFTYTGANAGQDTVSASAAIAGQSLQSNVANVSWQDTNNSIQVGSNIQLYVWGSGSPTAGDSTQSGQVGAYGPLQGGGVRQYPISLTSTRDASYQTATGNSLIFDSPTNWNLTSGGWNGYPGKDEGVPRWATLDVNGNIVGYTSPMVYSEDFNCVILANLVVPKSGSYTLSMLSKDEALWGIGGGATRQSGNGNLTSAIGLTKTAWYGFPLLDTQAPNNNQCSSWSTVNFPKPGVYPLEINWDYWYHSGRTMQVSANYGVISPVQIASVPAQPAVPSNLNLTVTPTGGATNLAMKGQPLSLTLTISNINFTQVSFVPILETVPGSLTITNGNNTFSFQTYNGQTVDKSSALNKVFKYSGDNTAYQGLISPIFDGTNYILYYTGGAPVPGVDKTHFVLSDEDIAWYNNKVGMDLYDFSTGGGDSFPIEFDYMVMPRVSSVTYDPSIKADGSQTTIQVTLEKPVPPQQMGSYATGNTINVQSVTLGGSAVVSYAPLLGGPDGTWLTGWNVVAQLPSSTTSLSLPLAMNVTGNLQYLKNNNITRETVTYINATVGTVSIAGVALVAPVAYDFNTAGDTNGLFTSSLSLNAYVYSQTSNPLSVTFYSRSSSGALTTLGTSTTAASSTPQTLTNGQTVTMQGFSLSNQSFTNQFNFALGFTVTDTVSGLTSPFFWGSYTYSYNLTSINVTLGLSTLSATLGIGNTTVTSGSTSPVQALMVTPSSGNIMFTPLDSGYATAGGQYGGGAGYIDVSLDGGNSWNAVSGLAYAPCLIGKDSSTSTNPVTVTVTSPFNLGNIRFRCVVGGGGSTSQYNETYSPPNQVQISW